MNDADRAEAERQERRERLEWEADRHDAEQSRIKRLEDEVKELKKRVGELYEKKMSRLHGGY